jgi:O-antigen ligase
MRTAPLYSQSVQLVGQFEGTRRYRLTCLALVAWWIASLYPLLAVQDVAEQVKSAADATAQGSRLNQAIVISFAALGAFYIPAAMRVLRGRPHARSLTYLLGGYLLWSSATIVWTDDATLSIRRLAQFVFLLIGVLGLGAGFYSRTIEGTLTLARHALYASWLAIAMLIVSRFWSQSLSELFNPEWTLKDDTAAQFYIYPLAYAVIAALIVYWTNRTKQVASLSFLLLMLLLLKGRAMLAGTLATSLLLVSYMSKGMIARSFGVLSSILLGAQIDLATGGRIFLSSVPIVTDRLSSWLPYLTLGNGIDDLLSLDGRVPLWQALWTYFYEHPFIGHGFGAFWNPDRLDEIYRAVTWPAVVAHNGFLDELLGTGVIGLALFLMFWLCSMRFSLRLAHEDDRPKYLVFGWLLLFLCFNSMGSLLQSYFQAPTLFSLTALVALLAHPVSYPISQKRFAPGHLRIRTARVTFAETRTYITCKAFERSGR